jgi:uncharacterized membrane protein YbhN (UPF0104 family)
MKNRVECDQCHIRSAGWRVQMESAVSGRRGEHTVGTEQAASDFALPAIGSRAVARKIAVPALAAGAIVAFVLLSGSRVHAVGHALQQLGGLSPTWIIIALAFEVLSLAGYVALMSLVMGRSAPRIGVRVSAQVTLAGAAATRLLPTAGAGGAALTLWTLRRAGLPSRAAGRALFAFFVVLYSVFLATIVLAGAALSLGWVDARGPAALGAIPAIVALIGIAAFCILGRARTIEVGSDQGRSRWQSRARSAAGIIGQAACDGKQLVRSRDPRLLGAVAYWMFDAAVLWAMLRAFGSSPALPVVALAYLVGQVANTVPLPGSVSGGTVGLLVAFGSAPAVALPAVLAYRAVSVWLPTPAALAAIPRLRHTIAGWSREDEPPMNGVARPDFSVAPAHLDGSLSLAA